MPLHPKHASVICLLAAGKVGFILENQNNIRIWASLFFVGCGNNLSSWINEIFSFTQDEVAMPFHNTEADY